MLPGWGIQIGRKPKYFGNLSPRERASWSGAIDELEGLGLIGAEGSKREVFSITNKGYQVADMAKAHQDPTSGPAVAKALDATDIGILRTIGDIGGAGAILNDIIDRGGLGSELNAEKLEDRLDHIETITGYIENTWATSTDSNGIVHTKLTAKGREFVRQSFL